MTVREIAGLYVYDNTLFALEGTGATVRAALENAARYFKTCPDPSCSTGPLIGTRVIGYNYDMAEGVEYDVDLTKPEGSRITNLRYHGKPLKDDQPLRIAVNNAGIIGASAPLGEYPLDVWRQVIEVNQNAVFYGMRAQLPAIAAAEYGGAIINIASILGSVGLPNAIAHGMFTMAQAGRYLTDWAGDAGALVEFGVRFSAMVVVPDDDTGAL